MQIVSVLGGSSPGRAARQPLLICFSHLRWNFVFQRPQHLLTRAARDFRVIYIEEPVEQVGQEPEWHIAEDCIDTDRSVTVATPFLPAGLSHATRICLLEALMGRLLQGGVPDVAWFYTPMALEFARQLPAGITVYDNMDELSLFHLADSRILLLETELLARADIVFTGGTSLYEVKRHRHRNIHPVPSSIDVDHFRPDKSKPSAEPTELAAISSPRVGFFGVIDERMDMALLDTVAALRPDLAFIMVGPVVKIDPATCPQRPNIHWLGARDYQELPRHLHHWNCGFMPFALNDATRFISPTKTPEFLAAGLPVVSTAVRDVVDPYAKLGLVRIGATPAEVAQAIDLAMSDPQRPGWRRAVATRLASSSWDSTWAFMQARIADAVEGEVEYAHA